MRTHLVLGLAGLLPLLAPPVACAAPAPMAPTAPRAPMALTAAQPEQESLDELIAEGRRLLDLRKPKDAEGVFLQARELDGGSLRTHMWVLRAWMDQGGRSNDTLNAIDELARVHDGPELDYLYGMAFARRAEEHIAQGLLNSVRMNFVDAIQFLERATSADPERFRDAFLALSRAAWYDGDLERAAAAGEQAMRRYPEDPETVFHVAQVALSRFTAMQADETRVSESERAWERARDGFARAAELCGRPNKKQERLQGLLANSRLQLGHTLMWKNQRKDAAEAYTTALAWNPAAADVGQLFGLLGNDLLPVLEEAQAAFAKRFGKDDPRDATVLWWMGYLRYATRERDAAEEAFLAALEEVPGFVNAWTYVADIRYDRKDYEGMIEALKTAWDTDPAAVVAEMPAFSLAKTEYVVGWCAQRERWGDAAILGEIVAETQPTEARHWNNLGLFLRDHGAKVYNEGSEESREAGMRLFERSFRAYSRALDLVPDDPAYLNDTAVILHYYLDRDPAQALAWYDEAEARASELLERDDLTPDRREIVRIALRDAKNNRRDLQKILERRAREAAAKKEEEEAPADGPEESPEESPEDPPGDGGDGETGSGAGESGDDAGARAA